MTDSIERATDAVRYLCLPGSPYTGSTLLGFLLNGHPDCVSIGAATGLTRRVDVDTYQCSCGRPFRECDFWTEIASQTAELGYPVTVYKSNFWNTHVRLSERRWLNGLLVRSLGNERLTDARDALLGIGRIKRTLSEARCSTWSLARSVLNVTGKKVFVDTARDHQRPKYLAPDTRLDVKAIHLIRDPRGNVASIMRHTGVGIRKAARQWKHYNEEAGRVRRYLPTGSWMRLHYEELCAEPQKTLDRIALFLGLEPAPVDEILDAADHHIIGNAMRLNGVSEIRLDERWRDRLSASDLEIIARISGRTSRDFGYSWP